MLEEAQGLLRTMRNELVKEFGKEVLQHFPQKYESTYKHWNGRPRLRYETEEDDYDEELENFILGINTTNPYRRRR